MSVVAVNRAERVVLFEGGAVGPIDVFLDVYGDETDDPEAAVVFVAELPDGQWCAELISDFEPVTRH